MRISTKGRYALRLMLDLSLNTRGPLITLKEIAKRQEISEKYLEQIVPHLHKAGLVRSSRGAQGGYALTKAPTEYKVGEIIRIMEGELAPVFCVGMESNFCARQSDCATSLVWAKIRDAVNTALDGITLQDLIDCYDADGRLTKNWL